MDTAALYIAGGAAVILLPLSLFLFQKLKHARKEVIECEKRIRSMIGDRIDSEMQGKLGTHESLAQLFGNLSDRLQKLSSEIAAERRISFAVLSAIDDGIFIVNNNGQVTMLNRASEELFSVSLKNVVGLSFIAIVRDHEIDAVVKQCVHSRSKQERTVPIDETRQSFRIMALPFEDGALVVIRDMTRIEHLEGIRKEFVSNVSHELRTPIASLKAIVETLRDGAIRDRHIATKFLNKTDVEIDKLAELVDELAELSIIESQGVKSQFELANLADICGTVIERMTAQAEKKQLRLRLDVPSFVPLIWCDKNRLEQVLVNLVHNAIKFTSQNGELGISIIFQNQSAVISVTDNGIGIPSDDLPHVFERFYKVDKARSSGGTGLGLAIAKHIVLAHGGKMWAESVEGEGSTFSFSIPATDRVQPSDKDREEVQIPLLRDTYLL